MKNKKLVEIIEWTRDEMSENIKHNETQIQTQKVLIEMYNQKIKDLQSLIKQTKQKVKELESENKYWTKRLLIEKGDK